VSATLMALGELTSFLRLGSFKYWQRQGFCSLSLLQHIAEGGLEEVMAFAHAISCNALHVTPIDNSVFARSKVSIMHNVTYENFIFVLVVINKTLGHTNDICIKYGSLHYL
jgi:hypothetical protein